MYRIIGFSALLVFSTAAAAQPAADTSCIATQASVLDALQAASKVGDRMTDFIKTHDQLADECSDQYPSLLNEFRGKLEAIEKAYNDGSRACSEQSDTMASLNRALTMAQTQERSVDSSLAQRDEACRDYHQSRIEPRSMQAGAGIAKRRHS